MESKTNDGFEIRELAKLMREEGIVKMQTSNCLIEIHPSFLIRIPINDEEIIKEKEEIFELSSEEKIARAKQQLNQMMGGI